MSGKIEKMREIDAARSELFLDIFEERFTEIANLVRDVRDAQEKAVTTTKGLLKKQEIAERLQISVSSVSKLQNEGLPSIPFGKSVRFEFAEVVEWAKGKREKSRTNHELRMVA